MRQRFVFDVKVVDADTNEMFNAEMKEVDKNGRLSIGSVPQPPIDYGTASDYYYVIHSGTPLPYTLEIMTSGGDNDQVNMCYSDECWTCPDEDGPHKW